MKKSCYIYSPMNDDHFVDHINSIVLEEPKKMEIWYSIGTTSNCESGVVSTDPDNSNAAFVRSYTFVPLRNRIPNTFIWVNSMFNGYHFGDKFFATECNLDFEQTNHILKKFISPIFQNDLSVISGCDEVKNYGSSAKRVSIFLK